MTQFVKVNRTRTSVDEIFCQRVLEPRSLAAYSCKFDLPRKSVEQIRKTPSKFSNITRAEVFWFSAPFCIEQEAASSLQVAHARVHMGTSVYSPGPEED